MQTRGRTWLAIAVALSPLVASAADETGKWYINPQIGYTWLDHARPVEDDYHGAIGFGKHLSEHWSLELNALYGGFESDDRRINRIDLDQQAYSLDALFVFGRANAISPYITFGGGYIRNDFDSPNINGPLAQAGVGLLLDVGKNSSETFVFQLRPEFKVRYDWADTPNHDDFHDYIVNLGFAFNFGPAPYREPASQPEPPPPPPPPDTDGDGVIDPNDQCPGTPAGVAVDSSGCPLKGSVTLRGVTFEFNSDALTQDSLAPLNAVAKDLQAHPRLVVELEGHTDNVGADAYNLQLSQRRADAVREYLLSQGVSPRQLTARGYGESKPVGNNKTEAGRAENRRVVMAVVENPGDVVIEGEEQVR